MSTMMVETTKQIILLRGDLGMSVGKACSQAAHAAMAFITKNAEVSHYRSGPGSQHTNLKLTSELDSACAEDLVHWLENSFTKIVLCVNSAEEMLAIHERAQQLGLLSYLIEDNGKTEFDNQKTLTACAIGPARESKFKGLTDQLKLYR